MSYFYNPFYPSPFYDFFDDISNAVEQVNQSLATDPNVAARKALQGKNNNKAVSKAPRQQAAQKVAKNAPENRSLISSVFGDPFFGNDLVESTITPAINIHENDKFYSLKVSTPGAVKENLTIDFNKDENQLIIKGEIPAEETDEKNGDAVVHTEIPAGKFERRLSLPLTVDGENIKATFENGILALEVPKAKNAKKLHRIEISESEEYSSKQ
ncbi:hypothetical protein FOA43_001368 [Brettanomyces nanus]|uniref:SHSP domain-containing protein n=1 Tax=Eeniella nana TaxID=13502 RepID=A0A875RZ98_EENNA|nr:uncharacterized protein FOA43_001368 [Brettanomyces nanus]QPG74048.1 hypothetical protein FOA43_001368 [Brettanomyces nanus]